MKRYRTKPVETHYVTAMFGEGAVYVQRVSHDGKSIGDVEIMTPNEFEDKYVEVRRKPTEHKSPKPRQPVAV